MANDATKWGKDPCFDPDSKWFRGPDYLYYPEAEWTKRKSTGPVETQLCPCFANRECVVEEFVDFARFFKLKRLPRTIALLIAFAAKAWSIQAFEGCSTDKLNNELDKAEISIWRTVQSSAYPDEVANLLKERFGTTATGGPEGELYRYLRLPIDVLDVRRCRQLMVESCLACVMFSNAERQGRWSWPRSEAGSASSGVGGCGWRWLQCWRTKAALAFYKEIPNTSTDSQLRHYQPIFLETR